VIPDSSGSHPVVSTSTTTKLTLASEPEGAEEIGRPAGGVNGSRMVIYQP
jgi:hypothetical protein